MSPTTVPTSDGLLEHLRCSPLSLCPAPGLDGTIAMALDLALNQQARYGVHPSQLPTRHRNTGFFRQASGIAEIS